MTKPKKGGPNEGSGPTNRKGRLVRAKRERDLLICCLYQFASYTDGGRTVYGTMCLSILEDLFAYFGLEDRVYTEEELREALMPHLSGSAPGEDR